MCFSSDVYLYFRILMYVNRHEQFEIGRGAILNEIYYKVKIAITSNVTCYDVSG